MWIRIGAMHDVKIIVFKKQKKNIIYEVHVQKQKFALLLHYWQVQPEPL